MFREVIVAEEASEGEVAEILTDDGSGDGADVE